MHVFFNEGTQRTIIYTCSFRISVNHGHAQNLWTHRSTKFLITAIPLFLLPPNLGHGIGIVTTQNQSCLLYSYAPDNLVYLIYK